MDLRNIKAIMEYFDEHEEVFNEAVEELDAINNCLGDSRYFEMDKIGHDEDRIIIENGEKRFAPFNTARKYFYIGANGKLVSTDRKDYTDYLNVFTIGVMRRNRHELKALKEDRELWDLFDE